MVAVEAVAVAGQEVVVVTVVVTVVVVVVMAVVVGVCNSVRC